LVIVRDWHTTVRVVEVVVVEIAVVAVGVPGVVRIVTQTGPPVGADRAIYDP